MTRLFMFMLIFIISCSDFAEDPISKVFRLTESLIVVNENVTIDPSKTTHDHFLYDRLYQTLSDISEMTTSDSLVWTVRLNHRYFSMPSKDLIETEDVYFSMTKNASRLAHFTQNRFKEHFKRFEKIDSQSMVFEFAKKTDFNRIASSSAFYIYSKYNTTFEIPIGSGTHNIILRPDENQYIIMPFIQFIHLQSEPIDTLLWVNSSKSEILNGLYNFTLPDSSNIKNLRNYDIR